MTTEIMPYKAERPAINADWDFNVSVEKVKPIIGRWKKEAKEMILPELWNAHEHLDGRGRPEKLQSINKKVKNFTFNDYCEEIGITRQTGRNWLIEAGLVTSGAHTSNNTGNPENYTPKEVIEVIKIVLGHISLDPASCEYAQNIIQAETYFDEEDDGLAKDWYGNIFLNPPYQMPQIKKFAEKVIEQIPNIEAGIVLTNNNTDTSWFHLLANNSKAVCFTKGRINFYTREIEKTQPTNGQTYFYFGNNVKEFVKVFSTIGLVMKTWEILY